jgi:hypothetical protein
MSPDSPVILVEKTYGRGYASLVTACEYPGARGLEKLCRLLIRASLSSETEQELCKATGTPKLYYSVFEGSGKEKTIYLLNTDYTNPVKAAVLNGEQQVSLEIESCDMKVVYVEGDNIYVTLDITMQGNIGEINCKTQHDMHDLLFLHSVEQAVAQEVSQNAQDSWKFQQQLGVDIPNVKARFKGYHPFEWKKIKDRWEKIYPTIPLIVSVNVNIRGVGEHD